MILRLAGVSPVINGRALYPGVTLGLEPNTVVAVMGVSGVGKSQLLNCINTDQNHTGIVIAESQCFNVFQDHRQLFPWLTVEQNLAMVSHRYHALVEEWQLTHLLARWPTELSIGQRQQLTLLRALTQDHEILLCDEPLSAVDGITKLRLARDFKSFVQRQNRAALWVTHDVMEACAISDHVLVLKPSHSLLIDTADITPEKLFEQVC